MPDQDWESLAEVECLQCGHVEHLDPTDIPQGIPYFCSERCQSDYHYELDPTNYVREEEG